MNKTQKIVASALAALFLSFVFFISGTYIGESVYSSHAPAAGSTFSPVQGTQFTISQTVLPGDTTINLSSFTTPDGRPLTMSMFGQIGYATLDPTNSTRLETITFTGITQFANGSAQVTGVSRGVDFVSPYAASSTLARTHLVGSNLILANTAAFYGQQFLFANQTGTSSAVLVFGSTTAPHYDLDPGASYWTTAASSTLVDLAQLQRTVLSGVTNASTIINGIVQLATAKQAASSTSLGSSGAFDVLQSSYATDTPNVSTNTSDVLMSDLTGHLKQGWLDLTAAFSVSGLWTFNAGSITTASSTFNPGTLHIGSQAISGAIFGGTGTDGALAISSGTTTLTGAINGVIEKDYTSISITGTANLTVSSASTLILRSQGACTITSSKINAIDVGGYINGFGGSLGTPQVLIDNPGSTQVGIGGFGGGSTAGAGSNTTPNATAFIVPGTALPPLATSSRQVIAGGNGSNGTSGGTNGFGGGGAGGGGTGGGAIYMECAGALNFTTGGIMAAGAVGGGAPHNTSGGEQGGNGGGGGGGNVLILYGSLTADTGTYNVSGGAGGNSGFGGGTGAAGGNGTHLEAKNTYNY